MTSMIPSGQILKTDVLGRVHTPILRREQLLDEFERSGLSGTKFAEVVGIKYQTLATWIHARRKKQGAYPKKTRPKASSVRWLEAVVEPAAANAKPCLVIQLPGATRMEVYNGTHATMASQLLKIILKAPRQC